MPEDKSKIIHRIKALMEKTIENGCTEEEQDAATRMIVGMMAKHGIEQTQLGEVPKTVRYRIAREIKTYEIIMSQAAAKLYGCKVVRYKDPSAIEFIGRPDNTEAAEATFFWLLSQLGTFYKQALPKGLTQKERSEYRRTFRNACAHRIYQRAVKLVEDLSTSNQVAQATTGSMALAVKGYFEALEAEADKYMEDQMSLKEGRAARFSLGSGSMDGMKAGDKVQLKHRELE